MKIDFIAFILFLKLQQYQKSFRRSFYIKNNSNEVFFIVHDLQKVLFLCRKSFVLKKCQQSFILCFYVFFFLFVTIYEREYLKLNSSYGDDKTIKSLESKRDDLMKHYSFMLEWVENREGWTRLEIKCEGLTRTRSESMISR